MTVNKGPGSAHRLLDPFAGKWRTEGWIRETADHPAIKIQGTDTYEWLPGGYFLLHRVDVEIGEERNETIEIIGFDQEHERYTMQHFDNKGNTGIMYGSVADGIWTFLGTSLRFTGGFTQDGRTLSGIWEQTTDGKNWTPLMDITLSK
ncbi:DUF1579 domain-containing protein [Chitinophaga agrisoli]|uniref:DUF1579 domain-containing protein n=1 Tax=Chitinophaga agrisoli TaxID=2607653 RepID=A0A5B2VS86_9BACT|nr:DUF1579 family protein [Chitinophaga agrisoli]KAA2241704.1 DUF1579 domain-containing protein [Chitinophaga agrisoli]